MATDSRDGGDEVASDLDVDSQPTLITPYGDMPAYSAAHYDNNTVLPTGPVGGRRARRTGDGGSGGADDRLTPSPLGRALVPVALAIVSAVALYAAWTHLSTGSDSSPAAAGSSQQAGTSTPAASTSPGATSSGGPAAPTGSGAASPSGAATSAAAKPSPTKPAATKPAGAVPSSAVPSSATVDRSVPLVVLNATGRPGLAAKVAARLRALGWKVVSVGNWTHGNIATTSAYLNGHLNAQATMAKDLPGTDIVGHLLPGMRPLRMTVVIGADYPR